jgi:hypothetical protein
MASFEVRLQQRSLAAMTWAPPSPRRLPARQLSGAPQDDRDDGGDVQRVARHDGLLPSRDRIGRMT